MDKILPDITFENIRAKKKKSENEKEKQDNEILLRLLLQKIKDSLHLTINLQTIRRQCPDANIKKVIGILKGRGFTASIIDNHLSLCECDVSSRGCNQYIEIKNTWSAP